MLKRLFILLWLLTGWAFPGLAQDSTDVAPGNSKEVIISPERETTNAADSGAARPGKKQYAVPNDRQPVAVRAVDEGKLRSIRNSRAYQYGTDVPPSPSLWDLFWQWFWYQVDQLMHSKAYRSVGQYLLIAAIAALVVWLLYKAELLSNIFPRRARQTGLGFDTLEENIHQIDFQDRISEAVANRDYRLAVRLLYLQTLKRLADGGLIRWQPDKTNRQYAYELTGNPRRLGFEQLTVQFEYAWYGAFPVDETRFARISEQFQQFNEQG